MYKDIIFQNVNILDHLPKYGETNETYLIFETTTYPDAPCREYLPTFPLERSHFSQFM